MEEQPVFHAACSLQEACHLKTDGGHNGSGGRRPLKPPQAVGGGRPMPGKPTTGGHDGQAGVVSPTGGGSPTGGCRIDGESERGATEVRAGLTDLAGNLYTIRGCGLTARCGRSCGNPRVCVPGLLLRASGATAPRSGEACGRHGDAGATEVLTVLAITGAEYVTVVLPLFSGEARTRSGEACVADGPTLVLVVTGDAYIAGAVYFAGAVYLAGAV
mmetsp:Transcript_28507/g.72198  ORF Transcript_28507/g.72198 Transcript_28507/m.72198 type:complete len:216 (-) Transcript_28507:1168-1815(-)